MRTRPFLKAPLHVVLAFLSTGSVCSIAQSNEKQSGTGPADGEAYYLVNQRSGLQLDSAARGRNGSGAVEQTTRSFSSLSQRWALTKLANGNSKISNLESGLCLGALQPDTSTTVVADVCRLHSQDQEWTLSYTSNGYYVIRNSGSGNALTAPASASVVSLEASDSAAPAAQSQLWLLRPVFFRGDDNALLGKQKADRIAVGDAGWLDDGQPADPLQILRNHGFNLIRVRPTPLTVPNSSTPLYDTYTLRNSDTVPDSCTGNGCHAETDAADLAIAKQAKQLGMSVQLSLFFDGADSVAAPGAWKGYTTVQVEKALYDYVKAQVEEYRAAGVMPDIVAIGNEVDTGFLGTNVAPGASGSPSGAYNSAAFTNFANYQKQGMQAVLDAASDPALGPPMPPPLRCIHITPGWDLTSFFTEVNQNNVPYEAICQSYYPFYHGPLTTAQAASCSSPQNYHVEQTALVNAANVIGKPIYLTEIGEHYENGNAGNDCFYPATRTGQRQFVLDLQSVLKDLPNNLAMGFDWWNGTGTNVYTSSGAYANNYDAGETDALYAWGGLTLFDDNDGGSGIDNFSGANYDAALPAMDAVGGKLDPTLIYKFVNVATGMILETAGGGMLSSGVSTGDTSWREQWQIISNSDGYFQIVSGIHDNRDTVEVLDSNGSAIAGTRVVVNHARAGTDGQEWNVMTTGNGTFAFVNKASELVLASGSTSGVTAGRIEQQAPSSIGSDGVIPASKAQQWQITPTYIKGVQPR